jgi:hypothetical protein
MVRSPYVITVALSLLVSALTLSVLVPPRPLTIDEEGEERGETFGTDAVRYRMMKLTDRFGRMPDNAYMKAKAHVDRLRWGGAVRRLESAPADPISPQMVTASDPAASAPAAAMSPLAWRWLGPGNVGGRIRSLAIKPNDANTMFAGSVGGGIWKTSNGGASWAPVDDFMAVLSVASLAINPVTPSVMYAGTGEGYSNGDSIRGAGIFKSTDGGTTWTQLASTSGSSFWQVNRLAVSPDGSVLLAATRSGLFRTTNGGGSFTQVSASRFGDVDFHPTDSSKAIAAGWGAAAYSIDGGLTWQAAAGIGASAGRIEVAYSRSQPAVVYASAELNGGTVLRSGNGGATFSVVSGGGLLDFQGWYDNALWVSPIDSNHLILGGAQLRQSFDGGTSWSGLDAYIHADHHVVVAHPSYNGTTNRRVFFGGDGGVNVADDLASVSTTGFRSLNNSLGVTQFYGAAGNALSGVIVGGTQDHGTVLRNPTSGTSWVETLGSDGGFVAADPGDPSYFYAETIYLGIYRSNDGGNSWTSLAAGISDTGRNTLFIAPFVLDPNNPNRMLAGGASVWRSNNVKAPAPAWSAITGSSSEYVSAIAVAPGNSDIVWVGRAYGSVSKSTNGTAAAPVFRTQPAPTAAMVTRITIHPFDPNIVYVTTGGFGSANILRTSDGGSTWSDATGSGTTSLPEAPVSDLEIDAANPDTIYAATEVGVFVSNDAGAHWELPQDGPANVCVDELFWMGSTLVAATHGRGLFAAETKSAGTPAVSISPTTIDFGSQTVGATSASRRAIVTNIGAAPLTVSPIVVGGANVSDWTGLTGTCTGTIPAGGTCSIDIAFRPGSSGARSGDLVLTTNASTSPDLIQLRGTGVAASTGSSLPAPWVSRDIGATGIAGAAASANGVFTISGAGADIWSTADAFRYAYVPLAGNGSIVARVADVQNVDAWTKAGVMIRQSVEAKAVHASMFVTPGKGLSFQRRTAAGGLSTSTTVAGMPPRWVRLTRAGGLFTASVSADGSAWTTVGQETIAMSGTVLAGLAVSSHVVLQTATAKMDHVAVTPASTLDSAWQSADVGAVGIKGSASSSGGTFTVSGSGADIWNTADAFQFVHQTLTGDGQLVARVRSIENTHRWSKAGVMIRANLNANAAYAMMLVSAGAGSSFQWRSASGGVSNSMSGGTAVVAPEWLKIVRAGSVLTGYQSSDGVTWKSVGSATVPMGASVRFGLAVTSHDNTKLAKAVFDSVK